MDPFIGQIIMFGGNFAPRGWASCEGQLIAISQNTALFSILGTTYGGDGRTTFALPDLRGRTPISSGRGPGLSDHRLGSKSGFETVALNQLQIPVHTHIAHAETTTTVGVSSIDAASATPIVGGSLAAVAAGRGVETNAQIYNSEAPDTVLSAGTATTNTTVTNSPTGNSQSHENMQPYLAVNYIIALFGVYPSRN